MPDPCNTVDKAGTRASFAAMKKRLLQSLGVILVAFNVAVGVRVYQAVGAAEKDDAGYENIAVFARAMQLVRQDYVDEKKVSYEELTHSALRGMLGNLDPHSQFMEPKDFQGMQDDTNSRYGGLGIVVAQRDGNIVIVTPVEDSRASRPGCCPMTRSSRSMARPRRRWTRMKRSICCAANRARR